jgi:hypothetical protein
MVIDAQSNLGPTRNNIDIGPTDVLEYTAESSS